MTYKVKCHSKDKAYVKYQNGEDQVIIINRSNVIDISKIQEQDPKNLKGQSHWVKYN